MNNRLSIRFLLPFYLLLVLGIPALSFLGTYTVSVISVEQHSSQRKTIVIDAGHGGIDGGTTSCTGVKESDLNLEIAIKLNDLFHLLGIHTVMIRNGDYSVHTEGKSISQIKISDLKERVKIANSLEHALLLSIHQNYYPDSQYCGAQIFYAPTEGSKELADCLQSSVQLLSPDNHRLSKKADGIYLMQKIHCPGILVECGFLSNPKEEALLRNSIYQNKLCSVIASVCCNFLNQQI